ncbi:uncharacterized protein J3D65DRAFT_357783 [Phyllosticta citribraziliensis]|uniref:Uncharacterized protein n=1 Tax=Phyllosticta citribraziliensis TaxID=989973 RepID=A0ABR1LQC3_9PEZI
MYSPGSCRPPSPAPTASPPLPSFPPTAPKFYERTLTLRASSLSGLKWMESKVAEVFPEHGITQALFSGDQVWVPPEDRHKFDPLTRDPPPSVSDVLSSEISTPSSSIKDEECSTPRQGTFATNADCSEVSELSETVRALKAEIERLKMTYAVQRMTVFRLEDENKVWIAALKAEMHKTNSEDCDDSLESQNRGPSKSQKAAMPPVAEKGQCSAEKKGEDRRCKNWRMMGRLTCASHRHLEEYVWEKLQLKSEKTSKKVWLEKALGTPLAVRRSSGAMIKQAGRVIFPHEFGNGFWRLEADS